MPQPRLKEDNVKTRNTDCDKNVFDEEIKSQVYSEIPI